MALTAREKKSIFVFCFMKLIEKRIWVAAGEHKRGTSESDNYRVFVEIRESLNGTTTEEPAESQ